MAEQSEPEVKEKKAKVKVERKSGRRATAAAEGEPVSFTVGGK